MEPLHQRDISHAKVPDRLGRGQADRLLSDRICMGTFEPPLRDWAAAISAANRKERRTISIFDQPFNIQIDYGLDSLSFYFR